MDAPRTFPPHLDHSDDGRLMAAQHGQVSDPARTFRTLVEQANDAILVLRDGKIVYRNPAHAKLFGVALGKRATDLFEAIVPEDRERAGTP